MSIFGENEQMKTKTPVVEAHPVGEQFVVRCPFCGRLHFHGAAVYGYRISHCALGRSYRLVPAQVQDTTNTQNAVAGEKGTSPSVLPPDGNANGYKLDSFKL